MRTESDSLGLVEVPGNSYFGAQTGRCLIYFPIGGIDERMPVTGKVQSSAELWN